MREVETVEVALRPAQPRIVGIVFSYFRSYRIRSSLNDFVGDVCARPAREDSHIRRRVNGNLECC